MWEGILKRYDVLDFHSKDFFAINAGGYRVGRYRRLSDREQKSSYGDWSDDKAEKFLSELLSLIQYSAVRPIGAYIRTSDFFSMTYGQRKFLTGGKFNSQSGKWINSGAPSKPYFLVYDHCVVEALISTKPGLKTLFVFDQQNQYESRAIQQVRESAIALNGDAQRLGDRCAGVLFHDRHDAPGLQAADLYAHCWYRYVTNEASRGPRYHALDRLTEKVPGMKWYSRDHLDGLFRHLPSDVRRLISEWPEGE